MKRNQTFQTKIAEGQVRLLDVGPRIEFFPDIKRFDWRRVQRQLPTAGVSVLTFVLVAYLTIGNGAAVAPDPPASNIAGQNSARSNFALLEAIENSLSAEQLGAESILLSRSRTYETVWSEEQIQPSEPLPAETEAVSKQFSAAKEALLDPANTKTEADLSAETIADAQETVATTRATTTTATTASTAATTTTATATTTNIAPATVAALTVPAVLPASTPVAVDTSSAMTTAQQQSIIELCRSLIGVPYVYAGVSASGLDCSGFTLYIYHELFNITLPHKAGAQTESGIGVAKSDARIGDILCFDWDGDSVCDHVAIYIGNNHYVNASRSRAKVAEQIVNFDQDPILTVRRLIN